MRKHIVTPKLPKYRHVLGTLTAAVTGALLALTVSVAAPAFATHGLPWHWNRNQPTATAVAQWYIEDTTGTRWPVNAGVQKWDNRPNFYRIFYRSPNTCNDSAVHCVTSIGGNYGTAWYGLATYQVSADGSQHIVHDSMLVRFNNQLSTTANQRESIVCHELGHSSGGFDDSGRNESSCMYGTDARFPLDPAPHDFDVLENNYDH